MSHPPEYLRLIAENPELNPNFLLTNNQTSSSNPLQTNQTLESSQTATPISNPPQTTNNTDLGVPPTNTVDFLVVPQDDPSRPAIYNSGDLYTLLATTEETNFGLNAFNFFVPFQGGPPPHIHNYEHEAFYVTEGEVTFLLGNEAGANWDFAQTGEMNIADPAREGLEEFILPVPEDFFAFGPRLRPHGFLNPNSDAAQTGTTGVNRGARVLSITTPGGLDLLFDFAGTPVTDRDTPIPPIDQENINNQLAFGLRTGGGIAFENYVPPTDVSYVLVFPENSGELKSEVESLIASEFPEALDYFSLWNIEERPRFNGPFGIDYISLASPEETGNELSYSQFFLSPQVTSANQIFQASLDNTQVQPATNSSAFGSAILEFNGDSLSYELTISGLDFGQYINGTPFTPDPNDDLVDIHIHSGESGNNGPHAFNILGPVPQLTDNDLEITLNPDGSVTLSGMWDANDPQLPPMPMNDGTQMIMSQPLATFVDELNSAVSGQEVPLYFQVHTEGNPDGEIRGQQIAAPNDSFPEAITSENHEAFYVKEGTLSIQIDGGVQTAEADTFIYIAPGQNYSIANLGSETVEALAISTIIQNQTITGTSEADIINPDGADVVFGAEGDDVVNASTLISGGNNFINGERGNDTLNASINDRVYGGKGDDLLDARSISDQNRFLSTGGNLLDGGMGNDTLIGGSIGDNSTNGDRMIGGSGADLFVITSEIRPVAGHVIEDFQPGEDKILISGLSGVSSFEDLQVVSTDDIRSSTIYTAADQLFDPETFARINPVPLTTLTNTLIGSLSADDFVFS